MAMAIAQIAPKKAVGRGVASSSKCSSPVAASATSPAEIGTSAIAWFTSRPFAERIGMSSRGSAGPRPLRFRRPPAHRITYRGWPALAVIGSGGGPASRPPRSRRPTCHGARWTCNTLQARGDCSDAQEHDFPIPGR